jgi:3-hydroxyacyl-CoA dehydrogenase
MTTHYERRGDVAVLQIDNPPVNGLGHATRRALIEGLERALDDRAVRAIVITGTDRVFSGGADIREFNTPAALAEPNLLQLIEAIERSPKAVIAAINGVCMGGGLELALGCNYRVATPDATLGLPEVKIGLLPGAGGTQRLPRAIGVEAALNMIVSGATMPAARFKGTALVDELIDSESRNRTPIEPFRFRDFGISGHCSPPRAQESGPLPSEFFGADCE